MRVLGVDPGLTRCGVGVVEGVPGRPCTLVGYYVVHSDPDDDLAERLLHLDRSLADLDRAAPARLRGRGTGVQPAQRTDGDGHRPGRRGRRAGRREGRPAGTDVYTERGEGGRHRLRSGRQGAGHGDGDQVAAARRAAPAGRRGRRARAGHLPHLARRHPCEDRRGRRARRRIEEERDDRECGRPGGRGGSGWRGDRGWRRRPRRAVHAEHARRPAGRSPGSARDQRSSSGKIR